MSKCCTFYIKEFTFIDLSFIRLVARLDPVLLLQLSGTKSSSSVQTLRRCAPRRLMRWLSGCKSKINSGLVPSGKHVCEMYTP